MAPFVSVIIPCFNGARYLREAVESVLSQTFSDLECIIVDDGSTDDTSQVSKALMKRDTRVKYFYKENGGVATARNFGIKHAKGEWIQLLDSDDRLHHDKIRFQLDYLGDFRPHEDIVFYSDYEVIWEDLDQNVVRRATNIIGDLTNEQLLERILKGGFEANIPLHPNNTLFRKSVFKKKLYKNIRHGNTCCFEDLELFVDLLLRNITFVYTPTIGMYYRIHQSNTTLNYTGIHYTYIQYLEVLYKKNKRLLQICPHMGRLIRSATKRRDKKMFDRLIEFIKLTQMPVYLSKRKLNVNKPFILKLAYFLKWPLPTDNEELITTRALLLYLKSVVSRPVRFLTALPNQKTID